MKNLELKAKRNSDNINIEEQYYIETLYQKDTYYHVQNGRLKIREERGKPSYAIYYTRPDQTEEKYCDYTFYPIDDFNLFTKVFGSALKQELVVEKERKLYLYENARIHFDNVKNLGQFIEIEVVIKTEEQEQNAELLMKKLKHLLDIKKEDSISYGYRELLIFNNNNKTLDYYASQNKVYWVVNKDINKDIKSNDIIPCIFVEKIDNELYILQFEESIKFDHYKYTAWRKLIGEIYNIYVDVLLIHDNSLYTLNNENIDFNKLKRSSKIIDKNYLAKIEYKY